MTIWVFFCSFFILALDESKWSASRPGRFPPRERTPNYVFVICAHYPLRMGAGLDVVDKRRIAPTGPGTPDRPAHTDDSVNRWFDFFSGSWTFSIRTYLSAAGRHVF